MRLRRVLALLAVSAALGCECLPAPQPCDGVRCGEGLRCLPATGRCGVADGAGGGGFIEDSGAPTGGGGGSDAGVADAGCALQCSGTTPVCDRMIGHCVTCTETEGCEGRTPVCDQNGGLGRCVVCTLSTGCSGARPFCDPTVYPVAACRQCLSALDCARGEACDLEGTCVTDDGGFGGGGGQTVFWDGVGQSTPCLPRDAGAVLCSGECPQRGFVCVAGQCVLRGENGPLRVTLRWSDDEDLDLHVREPLPDAGWCDIWYGAPNVPPRPIPSVGCGAVGWVDLFSNPACAPGTTRTENLLWPANGALALGSYAVRLEHAQRCAATPVAWEVEVHAWGESRFYCGELRADAGRVVDVTSFTLR